MPAIAAPVEPDTDSGLPFFHDVVSADGTRLRAWTNDPDHQIDGPTVLLCNGLGTSAWSWPALLSPDCGVRVISWNHRGVGGSDRPVDANRVGIEEFVEDALAVLDDAGVDKVTVMGWSMGVNTAFELAVRHPERIAGLFAVAGVPGDTFSTMLGPLRVPRAVARQVTVGLSRVLKYSGKLVSPVTTRLPVGETAVAIVSHSGFMFPVADVRATTRAIQEFLSTPVDWYFHLALRTSQHARVSLSQVRVPAAFVAATWDILAGTRHMESAAERLESSSYVELRGTHFIQMEQPDQVHELLLEFLDHVAQA